MTLLSLTNLKIDNHVYEKILCGLLAKKDNITKTMHHLPVEICNYIYEFDATYRDQFKTVVNELIQKHGNRNWWFHTYTIHHVHTARTSYLDWTGKTYADYVKIMSRFQSEKDFFWNALGYLYDFDITVEVDPDVYYEGWYKYFQDESDDEVIDYKNPTW
jgi:hypothetical protein